MFFNHSFHARRTPIISVSYTHLDVYKRQGYEGDELEHCGHVFSEMKEYNEKNAVEEATALVERVRSYWMEQAEQHDKREENTGSFAGFVLLSSVQWDRAQLISDLKAEWGLEVEEDDAVED